MKSTTFYRLLLGLPYLFLIPGYFAAKDMFKSLSVSSIGGPTASNSSGLLGTIMAFWGITGVFWIVPYTLFAIILFIWSRNKSKEIIRIWFVRSPFILAMASPIFYLLLFPFQALIPDHNLNGAGTFGAFTVIGLVCSLPFSLLFGFIFVGIGLLLYSVFFSLKIIRDEPSINQSQ